MDIGAVWYAVSGIRDHFASHLDPDERERMRDEAGGEDGLVRQWWNEMCQWECWACEHIDFNNLDDVWGYWCEEELGKHYWDGRAEGLSGVHLWAWIASAGKLPLADSDEP